MADGDSIDSEHPSTPDLKDPDHGQPLLPIRRIHNYVYCPRLFFLQWVEKIFQDNQDTVEGSHAHRRVDKPSEMPEEDEKEEQIHKLRSLALDSITHGITGVVDLLNEIEGKISIVEYKKGSSRRDENDARAVKENDEIQVAAQALLLRDNGYNPEAGYVYYAAEKRKIEVNLTPELEKRCLDVIAEAKSVAEKGDCPPPLENDPRCQYCSAYSICLPNESLIWAKENSETKSDSKATSDQLVSIKRRAPMADSDHREVLVVQKSGAAIGLRAGQFTVSVQGEVVRRLPLKQVRAIYVYGAIQISTQVITACLEEEISVSYFSPAGRFLGTLASLSTSGIEARRGQYELFSKVDIQLALARQVVWGKIHNQRVMVMRNAEVSKPELSAIATLKDKALQAKSLAEVLGIEGAAAALYFSHFSQMLKPREPLSFDFQSRNRRPPRDPVNALLSLSYSILVKELTGICYTVGLDPFFGFYHRPRYGRPALALDLMEEFRPLVADSVVISLVNRAQLTDDDFTLTTRGTFLTEKGRKIFWEVWFQRLDTEVQHPQFGFQMSYRRMFEIQARQLWRYLQGEAQLYKPFTTR